MVGSLVEFQLNVVIRELNDDYVSDQVSHYCLAKAPVKIINETYAAIQQGESQATKQLLENLLVSLMQSADKILVPQFMKIFSKASTT